MTFYIKIFATTFLTLIIFNQCQAQNKNLKIKGLIHPEVFVVDDFYVIMNSPRFKNFPYKELKLYTQPGVYANQYIKIEQAQNEHSEYLKTVIVDNEGNESKIDGPNGTIWTNFKSYNLVYYENKGDFVKIKINGSFYWLNKSQIANFGFTSFTWKDYFLFKNNNYLTVNCDLNLRENAGINNKKIFTLRVNAWEFIEITGNFKEQWAEVKLTIYKGNREDYRTHQIDKQITGWIKFLDDNGNPNIRSAPGGC